MQNIGDGTPDGNDIAINITGNNNKILGCYIGMDALGANRGTLTAIGIQISGANNQIGDGTAAGAILHLTPEELLLADTYEPEQADVKI
jgi:hypothetical protein